MITSNVSAVFGETVEGVRAGLWLMGNEDECWERFGKGPEDLNAEEVRQFFAIIMH